MTKYFLNALAFVFAITLVSYDKFEKTGKEDQNLFPDIYLIYQQGFGSQSSLLSYTQQQSPPMACIGSDNLCWFKADDINFDGSIDFLEFSLAFNWLDTNCNGTLDDESEAANVLDKKFAFL